jgi:hypothetical protein
MLTPQEQVQCVLWLAEFQSVMAVQRRFRMQYGRQPPTRKNIRFQDNKLRTTCSFLHVKLPGQIRTSEENANRIREAFQQSPRDQFLLLVCSYTNSTFNSARRATV